MLSRDEARGALVLALEARPLEGWVARELALTLARLEYRAGYGAAAARAHIARHSELRAIVEDTARGSRRAPRVSP